MVGACGVVADGVGVVVGGAWLGILFTFDRSIISKEKINNNNDDYTGCHSNALGDLQKTMATSRKRYTQNTVPKLSRNPIDLLKAQVEPNQDIANMCGPQDENAIDAQRSYSTSNHLCPTYPD